MTNEKRFKNYVKENCKNCKNNKKYLCDIRIVKYKGKIEAKCGYYERKD